MKYLLALLLTGCATLLGQIPAGTSVCVSISGWGLDAHAQLREKARARGLIR